MCGAEFDAESAPFAPFYRDGHGTFGHEALQMSVGLGVCTLVAKSDKKVLN